MSNEELAVLVQTGERESLLKLWENVRRFAWKAAAKWPKAGLEQEDMMQAAFLALLEALEGFSPDKGGFLGWYSLRLRAAFTEAAGQRTERQRLDPLRAALSLDAPLDDAENGGTLADVIPDPGAALALEIIEEQDRQQRLHDALAEILAELPEDLRAEIVSRYWRNRPGNNRAHQAALRFLRHPRRAGRLRAFL